MAGWKLAMLMISLCLAGLPARLAAAPPSAALAARSEQLVPLLNGTLDPTTILSPDMLKQVPAASR
jgi:hypothetical protein